MPHPWLLRRPLLVSTCFVVAIRRALELAEFSCLIVYTAGLVLMPHPWLILVSSLGYLNVHLYEHWRCLNFDKYFS